jgi:uncharacterized protein YbgA (DUF1722 family)/uncharacterized protein YbbK (DUF523 family)
MDYATFIPVCPEVEIGLGIPRDPVRIIRDAEGDHLIQPATDRDFTREMEEFCASFLESLPRVDGFVLKGKSPTSGLFDAKVYSAATSQEPVRSGPGFFGRAVLTRFPTLPAEDEVRLKDPGVCRHFLTAVYATSRFHAAVSTGEMAPLLAFHTSHTLLLMVYDQALQQEMGSILVSGEHRDLGDLTPRYGILLARALARPPGRRGEIKVLTHAIGYFKDLISARERRLFDEAIEEFLAGTTTSLPAQLLLQTWVTKFDPPTLNSQVYFEPFPQVLMAAVPDDSDLG